MKTAGAGEACEARRRDARKVVVAREREDQPRVRARLAATRGARASHDSTRDGHASGFQGLVGSFANPRAESTPTTGPRRESRATRRT
eukprot:31418-Pelagococcus_subviridis.AAC.14